eukprot:9910820-Prorocentrum_lima.AAC.1
MSRTIELLNGFAVKVKTTKPWPIDLSKFVAEANQEKSRARRTVLFNTIRASSMEVQRVIQERPRSKGN